MLRRVAALCFAAFIVVWPACAGSDTDTFWNTPSAAVLASASPAAPAPAAAPAPEPELTSALAPVQQQVTGAAEVKADDQGHGDAGVRLQSAIPVDRPERTAALDPIEPTAPTALPPPVSVPFGLDTAPVAFGGILTKWNGVEEQIRAGNGILTRCRTAARSCPKAARILLAIVAQGRAQTGLARIGVINRAVNMAIEPMTDMAQWGVVDRWSPPLETFTTGRGDCEDYAIAKYVALTAAGVPAQDVKLVVVRNTAANEDHAVVAVRNDGHWIILDNRWLMLFKDAEMPNAIPLFVLDDDGVRQFISPTLTVARQTPAPASVRF